MPRIGRPKRKSVLSRCYAKIRLTAGELRNLKAQAKAAKMTLSSFIRSKLGLE